jgi:hypothetical protein
MPKGEKNQNGKRSIKTNITGKKAKISKERKIENIFNKKSMKCISRYIPFSI